MASNGASQQNLSLALDLCRSCVDVPLAPEWGVIGTGTLEQTSYPEAYVGLSK